MGSSSAFEKIQVVIYRSRITVEFQGMVAGQIQKTAPRQRLYHTVKLSR